MAAPEVVDAMVAEKDFTRTVIEALEWAGYRVFHSYDSRRDTEYGETAKGFPDLVALRSFTSEHATRLLVLELKTERGSPSAEQLVWLALWMQVPGAEVKMVKPHAVDSFLEWIK